jgi:hypothetical protein
MPGERVLESGDVTAYTGLVKLDVKIHNCVHGREGGHEQTHIALGALPKMVENALDGRVCSRREERRVKIAVTFPELKRNARLK